MKLQHGDTLRLTYLFGIKDERETKEPLVITETDFAILKQQITQSLSDIWNMRYGTDTVWMTEKKE